MTPEPPHTVVKDMMGNSEILLYLGFAIVIVVLVTLFVVAFDILVKMVRKKEPTGDRA